MILKLLDHLVQPLHSRRLGNIIYLIPIMLILLIVLVVLVVLIMLVVLVMLVALTIANILSHVHTLTPCGNHFDSLWWTFAFRGDNLWPHGGCQCSDVFSWGCSMLSFASPSPSSCLWRRTCKGLQRSSQNFIPLKCKWKRISHLPRALRSLLLYPNSNIYSPILQWFHISYSREIPPCSVTTLNKLATFGCWLSLNPPEEESF